jgi:BolA family transcriptional regulator, general stress-responsive regulator
MSLAQSIEASLAALEPESIELLDESAQHLGHSGWKAGGSHFRLLIVSRQFAGKSRVERHRIVYAALGPLMNEVHALAINALAPDEL